MAIINNLPTRGGYKKYSYNEKPIGKWIDGKTIYQKTWSLVNVTNASRSYDIDVSIDTLIYAYGSFYTSAYGWQPIGNVVPDNISKYGIGIGNIGPNRKIGLNVGTSVSTTNKVYFTLIYTKA